MNDASKCGPRPAWQVQILEALKFPSPVAVPRRSGLTAALPLRFGDVTHFTDSQSFGMPYRIVAETDESGMGYIPQKCLG